MADTTKVSTFTRSGKAELDAEQTFTVTRQDTSYTHSLRFEFAGEVYYIKDKVTDKTIKWTPSSKNIAPSIPNSTSGRGKFVLTTYTSSGKTVGTSTLNFDFSLPDTVVPTVTSVKFTEAENIIKELNLPTETFVNTLSRINYEISAEGIYGSTIKSYSITIAGVVYSEASGTTEVINRTPQLYTTLVTATDSRGRRGTTTATYRILEYEKPQITYFGAERNKNDEAKIDFGFSADISELNQENKYSILLTYRITGKGNVVTIYQYSSPKGTDEQGQELKETTFNALHVDSITPENSTDNEYEFELVISDKFSTVSRTVNVASGTPVFDVYNDGSGMGFSQVSKQNEYGFAKPVAFYGGWKAKEIEASAAKPFDLDNLKQAGIYHCSETTNLTNNPHPADTNITASLMVLECGNYGQFEQIYTVCTRDGNFEYRRFHFYEEWGEWYRTSGEVILWQTDENGTEGQLGTGGLYMQGSQTIDLSEPISKQPNGIRLVFCRYYNEEVLNGQMQTFTVSKTEIAKTETLRTGGVSHTFLLTSEGNFSVMAAKALYISDTQITGHANNVLTGTAATGIKYTNNAYVLRYVIGC